MFRSFCISAAFIFAMLIAPAASHAACNANRIAGTWYILIQFNDGILPGWNNCIVSFDKDGNITGDVCRDLDLGETTPDEGDGPDSFGGQFLITPSCRVEGTLTDLTTDTDFTVEGFVSRDAQIINGVIYEDGAPNAIITFSGVKK